MSRIEKALEKAIELRSGAAEIAVEIRPVGGREHAGERMRERDFDTGALRIDHPAVITVKDPESPIAEEYRKLKAMVVEMTKQGGFQNTLMITSSLAQEGKSLTSLNFAITMAQEYDHTVLLVDADLRRPSLHNYFGLHSDDHGLTDCLLDECDIGDALIKTGIGKLSFLSAGRKVKNPAELLSSVRMREFINELKMRYVDRYIIIDTPPLLAFAETHSLSNMVDGVIFVVKEGAASPQQIQNGLDILKQSRVLGLVYNSAGDGEFADRYYDRHDESAGPDHGEGG